MVSASPSRQDLKQLIMMDKAERIPSSDRHSLFFSDEEERTIPFLKRLTEMLRENDTIISFYPGGTEQSHGPIGRIVVHDRKKMEQEVLPKYFNHSSFASLRRQLNYFSFARVGKGRSKGATYVNEDVVILEDILSLKRRHVGSSSPPAKNVSDENAAPTVSDFIPGATKTSETVRDCVKRRKYTAMSTSTSELLQFSSTKRVYSQTKVFGAISEQVGATDHRNTPVQERGTPRRIIGSQKPPQSSISWDFDHSSFQTKSSSQAGSSIRPDHLVVLQEEDLLGCALLVNLGHNAPVSFIP